MLQSTFCSITAHATHDSLSPAFQVLIETISVIATLWQRILIMHQGVW